MRGRTRTSVFVTIAAAIAMVVPVAHAPAEEGAPQLKAAAGKKIGAPALVTKSIPLADGYSMVFYNQGNYVSMNIEKEGGESLQAYTWAFQLPSDAITLQGKKMARATLDATLESHADIGASGSIHMTSTKETANFGPLDGCEGVKGETRGGTFTGSFEFDTGTDLFGVIETNKLKIDYLRRSVGKSGCIEEWPCPPLTGLGIHVAHDTGDFMVFAERTKSGSSIWARLAKRHEGAQYYQVLIQEVPDQNVTIASDLSSASVQGAGAVTGSMEYVAYESRQNTDKHCGDWEQSFGDITGDLAVEFDVGTFAPLADGGQTGYVNHWP